MRNLLLGTALALTAACALGCRGDVSKADTERARAAERTEPRSGGIDAPPVDDGAPRENAAR